jgi:hypothetical protein
MFLLAFQTRLPATHNPAANSVAMAVSGGSGTGVVQPLATSLKESS